MSHNFKDFDHLHTCKCKSCFLERQIVKKIIKNLLCTQFNIKCYSYKKNVMPSFNSKSHYLSELLVTVILFLYNIYILMYIHVGPTHTHTHM